MALHKRAASKAGKALLTDNYCLTGSNPSRGLAVQEALTIKKAEARGIAYS